MATGEAIELGREASDGGFEDGTRLIDVIEGADESAPVLGEEGVDLGEGLVGGLGGGGEGLGGGAEIVGGVG